MKTKTLIAILLVIAIFIISSCSSNISGRVTEEKTKIGIIAPLTGDLANIGNSLKKGIEQAVKESNYKNIELIFEDNQGKNDQTINAVKKLLEIDKVDLIITQTNAATLSALPLIKEKGTLHFAITMDETIAKENKNSFVMFVSNYATAEGIHKYLQEKGITELNAIINDNSATKGIVNFLTEKGVKVNEQLVNKEIKDFKTELLKIKYKNGPILILVYSTQLSSFIKNYIELGFENKLIGDNIFSMLDKKDIPDNTAYITLSLYEEENVKIAEYKKVLGEFDLSQFSFGYDSINMYLKSLQLSKNNNQGIIPNLLSIKEYKGLSGELGINANRYLDYKLIAVEV